MTTIKDLHLFNPLAYPESSLWGRLNKQHLLQWSLGSTALIPQKVGGFGVEARESKGVCDGGTTGLGESLAPKAIP